MESALGNRTIYDILARTSVKDRLIARIDDENPDTVNVVRWIANGMLFNSVKDDILTLDAGKLTILINFKKATSELTSNVSCFPSQTLEQSAQ